MALKLGDGETARAEYEALLLPSSIELSEQQQAVQRFLRKRASRSAASRADPAGPALGCLLTVPGPKCRAAFLSQAMVQRKLAEAHQSSSP